MHLTAGTLASIVVVAFSLFFPFFFTPTAAKDTYKFAFWQYDPQLSHFDNTAWTYGKDYFLAVFMLLLGASIIFPLLIQANDQMVKLHFK